MKTSLLICATSLGLAASLAAAPISFDFKDPKGVNAIQFSLDSVLEPIAGTASGITGKVSFDPANPGATTGKINVATKSLVVPNSMMNGHLLGEGWLNAPANPEITFELTTLAGAKTAIATGKFTLKGVTKEIKVPVTITYLPDAFGKRINKPEIKGDLLVLRGEFTITRGDYGIQPGQNEDKVNTEIKLSLAVVGSAPKA
jgi:polyisoprenoid-binding protein YceI